MAVGAAELHNLIERGTTMLKKGLGYTVALIALYLGVNNAANAGKLMTDGANGFATVTKTLQGRG